MSQLPTNDQTLINFLKQYRSTAPEATPELEELIMATLDTDDRLKESQHQSSPLSTIQALGWVSSLIAASLTLLWIGDRILHPPSLTTREQSQLEGFIESNWEGAMEETQETSWFTMLESSKD